MFVSLVIPTALLMALAVGVTRAVETRMPESVPGLCLLAAVASVLLWLLSAIGFAGLYALQAPGLSALIGALPAGAGFGHFLRLGALAGLIWGPVMALTVVTAPRRWKDATW